MITKKSVLLSLAAVLLCAAALCTLYLVVQRRISGLNAGSVLVLMFVLFCVLLSAELKQRPYNHKED